MGRPFPLKTALCHGGSRPHLTCGSLSPLESTSQLYRFSGFCRAHDRDRQTDRQATLFIRNGARYSYAALCDS